MRRVLWVLLSLIVAVVAARWRSLAPPRHAAPSSCADARRVRGATARAHAPLGRHGHARRRREGRGARGPGFRRAHRSRRRHTQRPTPPRYVDGVLLVDGVEISTTGGHYVALGSAGSPRTGWRGSPATSSRTSRGSAASASPRIRTRRRASCVARLAGAVRRPRVAECRQRRGATSRERAWPRAIVTYWWRRPEVIASLLDRPVTPLARWDTLNGVAPVVGVAGHDAHARMGPRGDWEPGDGGYRLRHAVV